MVAMPSVDRTTFVVLPALVVVVPALIVYLISRMPLPPTLSVPVIATVTLALFQPAAFAVVGLRVAATVGGMVSVLVAASAL